MKKQHKEFLANIESQLLAISTPQRTAEGNILDIQALTNEANKDILLHEEMKRFNKLFIESAYSVYDEEIKLLNEDLNKVNLKLKRVGRIVFLRENTDTTRHYDAITISFQKNYETISYKGGRFLEASTVNFGEYCRINSVKSLIEFCKDSMFQKILVSAIRSLNEKNEC